MTVDGDPIDVSACCCSSSSSSSPGCDLTGCPNITVTVTGATDMTGGPGGAGYGSQPSILEGTYHLNAPTFFDVQTHTRPDWTGNPGGPGLHHGVTDSVGCRIICVRLPGDPPGPPNRFEIIIQASGGETCAVHALGFSNGHCPKHEAYVNYIPDDTTPTVLAHVVLS